jgi:hypothetical protein
MRYTLYLEGPGPGVEHTGQVVAAAVGSTVAEDNLVVEALHSSVWVVAAVHMEHTQDSRPVGAVPEGGSPVGGSPGAEPEWDTEGL